MEREDEEDEMSGGSGGKLTGIRKGRLYPELDNLTGPWIDGFDLLLRRWTTEPPRAKEKLAPPLMRSGIDLECGHVTGKPSKSDPVSSSCHQLNWSIFSTNCLLGLAWWCLGGDYFATEYDKN